MHYLFGEGISDEEAATDVVSDDPDLLNVHG